MPDSILQQLRQQTAASHEALEHDICIEKCLAHPSKYLHLLEAFFGFYAPMESLLEKSPARPAGYDPSRRRKSPWLIEDLQNLGRTPEQIDALPCCSDLPEIHTPEAGMGCAYVLEGSTLGGRSISKLLTGSSIPTSARRFFSGYGEDTGNAWKAFCGALEAFSEDSRIDREKIIAAADATFRSMRVWLEARKA